jgi:hypothetical protein
VDAVTIATYRGQPVEAMIADRTNPWVEVPTRTGPVVIDWTHSRLAGDPANDCEGCSGGPLPGVIAPMDTDEGVQRCDTCQKFDGDLAAAHALALLVGGVVKYEIEED